MGLVVLVGMHSRASGVARLEAVAAPSSLVNSHPLATFVKFYGRATPDARERIPTSTDTAQAL
jgi:hypothetical protein